MSISIGYSDFIRLFRIEDPADWRPGLEIRDDGVYVAPPPSDVLLTLEERTALTDHPTGNVTEPVLSFPFGIDELKPFVERYGLLGCIDAFDMIKFVRIAAFEDAHVKAADQASSTWPVVSGIIKIRNGLRASIEREKGKPSQNDSRLVAMRELLDQLEALFPDPSHERVGPDDIHSGLGKREENSLLRIIAALATDARIPLESGKGGADNIAAACDRSPFGGPKADTIRKVLDQIRSLDKT